MKQTFFAFVILVAALFAPTLQAGLIVSDDFSAGSVTSNSRLREVHEGVGWVANANSLWDIAGGVLQNPGTTAGVPSEGAILQVVDVTGFTGSQIELSFDYTVGTGSTLVFHTIGLHSGTFDPTAQTVLHNTGAQNGSIQSQFDAGGTANGDHTGVNLSPTSTGLSAGLGSGESVQTFGAGTSGTYSLIIDIPTETAAQGGTSTAITDISGFDLITFGFGSDVTIHDGTGGITIDNFELAAIPEPHVGVAMIILFLIAGLCFRSRRFLTDSTTS